MRDERTLTGPPDRQDRRETEQNAVEREACIHDRPADRSLQRDEDETARGGDEARSNDRTARSAVQSREPAAGGGHDLKRDSERIRDRNEFWRRISMCQLDT